MKKFISYAAAAVLSLGIIGASLQPADAGRRGDRVAGALALGLIGGALLGGAIARDRYYDRGPRYRYRTYERPRRIYRAKRRYRPVRRISVGRAHAQWCYDRYRSYRRWDNSFQPYHGPRRACLSPYN